MAQQNDYSTNTMTGQSGLRSRWSAAVLAAGIIVAASMGLRYSGAEAATTVTIKGRVYNATNGAGLAGAQLNLCHGHSATTDANGNWSYSGLPQRGLYCVRYIGGVGNIAGSAAPNSRSDQGERQTYEYQAAGYNCYQDKTCASAEQHYDLVGDDGLDLALTLAAPATPAPTPDATPPSMPAVLQALAAPDTAVVTLTWDASKDAGGIKAYQIDRSVDQLDWTTLSNATTDATYRDDTAAFSTHYYYRVRASDGTNWSDFATVDVRTPEFTSNTAETDTTYKSDDGLASVVVPGGAFTVPANCRLTVETVRQHLDSSSSVVGGPYVFTCRTIAGSILTDITQPLTWNFDISKKMVGHQNPSVMNLPYGEKTAKPLTDSVTYNQKQGVLHVTTSKMGTMTIVAAVASQSAPATVLIVGALSLLAFGAVATAGAMWWLSKRKKKIDAQEQLRSKYYDI
jgi:hypothetical protein